MKVTKETQKKQVNGKINSAVQPIDNQQNFEEQSNTGNQRASKIPKIVQIQDYLEERYEFRFNTVALDIEYRSKEGKWDGWKTCNESTLSLELYQNWFTGFDKQLTALFKSDFMPHYDPIRNYFESLPKWDGQTNYIGQLASFVWTSDQTFFYVQFEKMLVRMIAQAYGTIQFNKQCLILCSTQNDGKTHFLRYLCPPTLARYIKDNPPLADTPGKRALAEYFILNIDDMSNLNKTDLSTVKALFAETSIKVRLPYDKKDSIMLRKASFVGSTNNKEFLTDSTGNVRWLVFDVTNINHDNGGPKGYASVDIDSVWAQAYSLYLSDYNCQLTKEEIAHSEANNEGFSVNTSEYELLATYFTPKSKDDGGKFYNATDLITRLTQLTNGAIRLKPENIGKALQKMKVPKGNGKRGGISVYGYYLSENLLGNDGNAAGLSDRPT